MPEQVPVETGSVEDPTPDSELQDVDLELNRWANQPAKQTPPRGEGGKFRKTTPEQKEVGRVLAGTVKGMERQPPEGEEQQEEAGEEEEEQVRRPPQKRNTKVKALVNGVEEEIDLDDEEYQKVSAVQATRAAQKAWREAAQMRKEAQQFRQMLDAAKQQVAQNPMALFQALGIPEEQVYQFAQQRTIEKLSETIDPTTGQPYTPEQQRIIQLQKELQRKEQAEKQAQQAQQQQEFEKVKEVVRQDIDRKFTAALQETGLPPTQYTMMRLADLMQSMGPDADPMTVAPLVLEDLVNETRQTIYSMPVEVAAEILGEDWLNELRKWDIEKARAGKDKFGRNPRKMPGNASQRVPSRGGSKPAFSQEEAKDWLDKWADGKV